MSPLFWLFIAVGVLVCACLVWAIVASVRDSHRSEAAVRETLRSAGVYTVSRPPRRSR